MFKIKFLPYNIEVESLPKETLIEIAMRYGIHINANCGGSGVCNKCKVIIEKGEVEGEILENNVYKACTTYPKSDLIIRIPVESDIDKRIIFQKTKRKAPFFLKKIEKKLSSPFKKLYLELRPPTIEENFSDYIRLSKALEQRGIYEPEVSLSFLQKLPYILRQKDFKITLNLYYHPKKNRYYLIDVESGHQLSPNLGVAVDLGTTTLQLELIDLNTGEVLAFNSDYNPQISYGEDVISRIEFTKKKEGLKILSTKVKEKIVLLIEEMLRVTQKDWNDINLISVAGNTVMTHLFLELEPKYLREYPYAVSYTHLTLPTNREV